MIINNIDEYCAYLGVEKSGLKRAIYKNTECGAWIEWDKEEIRIGSIVEGSDAEFEASFPFPCDTEEIEIWFNELERLTDEAWEEANGHLDEDLPYKE